MKKIAYLLLITGLAACGSVNNATRPDPNQFLVVDYISAKDTLDLSLSELVEDCHIVRLETNKDAYFDRAWHTSISENYIAIKSYGKHPVKLFSIDGRFIRNIGAIGRGPGEYTALYGIQLDEANNCIYLTPFANADHLMVYSLDGQILEDIPLAFKCGKVRTLVKGGILTAVGMPLGQSKMTAWQQKLDGTVVSSVPAPPYLFAREFSSEIFCYFNTAHIDFHNTVSDTLYRFNTEKQVLEPAFMLRKPEGSRIYSSLYSLPGYYYAWISNEKRILVNKATGKTFYGKLRNDFYGGIQMDFWGGFDGKFINVVAAIDLKSKIEEGLLNKKLNDQDRALLQKMDAETNMEDNPIVFYGQFKKI